MEVCIVNEQSKKLFETSAGSSSDDCHDSDYDSSEIRDEGTGRSIYDLSNPRIVPDSSMNSGQITTWDCVWK